LNLIKYLKTGKVPTATLAEEMQLLFQNRDILENEIKDQQKLILTLYYSVKLDSFFVQNIALPISNECMLIIGNPALPKLP